ncbi:ABC transporter permease [Nocardioides bigeumensis]|uniref:Autoinducer 2 import system permease protein LsrD n=1 Tax=Nocardioides bigeumensis TaxID=433657 RepID=A0ABP5KPW7_9ACTN
MSQETATAVRVGERGAAVRSFASRKVGFLASAAVLVAFFAINASISEAVLTTYGFSSFVNAGATVALAAAGLSVVVMAGGLDLSVAAVVALVNVVVATRMQDTSASMMWVSLLAVGIGVAAGALNGVLVTTTGLPSVIVTLATFFIWGGAALLVLDSPGGSVPFDFADLLTGVRGGVPNAVLLLLGLCVLWLLLSRTSLRVNILALGGDRAAARANGVPVAGTEVAAFAIAGFCYGLAGLFLSALTVSGTPNLGADFTLNAFAAVVVGGTQFGGGRGTPVSGLIGAFVLYTSYSILFTIEAPSELNYVLTGAILVVAVVVQNPRRLLVSRSAEPVSGAGG